MNQGILGCMYPKELEGLGTHVHLWLIHVNVWQNQYSIVKQNKAKIKIKKKTLAIWRLRIWNYFIFR